MTNLQFENNVKPIENQLFGFAMKLTKNEADANDLFQETIYKAFKNKESFQEGSNFKSWSSTIMYNTFINTYRKKRKRNLISAPVEDVAYAKPSTSHPAAESQLNEERIKNAINQINEKYRGVFLMHVEGFKYKEIAAKKNMPIGTVKSRINTARTLLQNELADLRTIA